MPNDISPEQYMDLLLQHLISRVQKLPPEIARHYIERYFKRVERLISLKLEIEGIDLKRGVKINGMQKQE